MLSGGFGNQDISPVCMSCAQIVISSLHHKIDPSTVAPTYLSTLSLAETSVSADYWLSL